MYTGHVTLFGKLIEARVNGYGGRTLLVGGRFKARKWSFLGLLPTSFFFDMEDAEGAVRAVEVCVVPGSFNLLMRVLADGHLIEEVKMTSKTQPDLVCRHCLYSLKGLTPQNGEYRCPECGRHTPATE